ncbi:DinB family protein [Geomicrobium sp. JCM 19055]|uniref:DinB family protein n=1 Tax=Geomicrobium sp. JCM 19055 TaxID=1460649 RepID=UPI00045ED1E5|nr:DinB family protein [Geomicrobium sp. JCM 19055]GAJ97457.1 DinB family protein [Geomicrobium sp. JCM 19055]
MYRTVEDFIQDWTQESRGTAAVIAAITDEKLDVSIVEGHSSLGWLAWHLATSPAFFLSLFGVKVNSVGDGNDVPSQVASIRDGYQQTVDNTVEAVKRELTDDLMLETVEAMGQDVPRGALLRTLVNHQTHHRGQMTVLLRQAGLQVPGVMGPTKEGQM